MYLHVHIYTLNLWQKKFVFLGFCNNCYEDVCILSYILSKARYYRASKCLSYFAVLDLCICIRCAFFYWFLKLRLVFASGLPGFLLLQICSPCFTQNSTLIFRLVEDTAWQPVWEEEFNSSPFLRKAIVFGYGPFRPWMSIAHWYLTSLFIYLFFSSAFITLGWGWTLVLLTAYMFLTLFL